MKFQQLLGEVKSHVIAYFKAYPNPHLIYHTIKHTKEVVNKAGIIANHYKLNNQDFFIVTTAAWFHDAGYLTDRADHENHSMAHASEFLMGYGLPDEIIQKVKGCINATKIPQSPIGLLQQILCDADLFHLGTDDFARTSKLLHKESELIRGVEIDKHQWLEKNIEFLEGHHYFTEYAQVQLNGKQEENLNKLKQKIVKENQGKSSGKNNPCK